MPIPHMMSARGRRPLLSRMQDDRGFLLIEVVISAALLLTISFAALTALDKADSLAGDQQKRTIAANVAQSELERVRSLPLSDVANLRVGGSGDSTKTLNGITYNISTGTKWLSDGKDTVDCSADGGGLDYLQATTTVTWKGMTAKPLVMSTLIAPSTRAGNSDEGSLSIQITDANGNGVANLPVSLTGRQSFTDNTDAQGCVVWGSLDAADPWTLKFSKSGYVDADGEQDVEKTFTLTAGATTQQTYLYDRSGSFRVLFLTRITSGNDISTNQDNLTIANSQMTGDKVQTLTPATSNWDGSGFPLFPFQSTRYTLYAGTCTAALPPTTTAGILTAPALANITSGVQQPVRVWVPSLDLTVRNGTGTPISGATVKVTDACGITYTRTTNASGKLDNTGFPYFKYNAAAPNPASTGGSLCVSSGGRRFQVPAPPATTPRLSNASFDGATAVNVTINGFSPSGNC